MGGSHETPFKMKGSGHYGLGNSSPAKAKSPSKHWREFGENTSAEEAAAVTAHNEHMRKKAAPKFKSSPAKHSKFGKPHPINPKGKEQQPGAGHPPTARAHNVKVEKEEK